MTTLPLVGVALVIVVPGEMLVSAVAGTGDTRMGLVFELAGTVCILLYTYAAAFHFGQSPAYVWGFLIVGWLVWLMSSAFWLHSGRWKRLRI